MIPSRDPELERGVQQTAMACIERWYAREANGGRPALEDLKLHFHAITLDGNYAPDRWGTPRFRPVTRHTSDTEKLVVELSIAC